jgi:hypothetical protein
MNFIVVLLVIVVALVAARLFFVDCFEIPRLQRETRKDVEIISNWFGDLCKRVKEIESARGTFSRQLAEEKQSNANGSLWLNNKVNELTGEVDKNITSLRQEDVSLNRRVEQLYKILSTLESSIAYLNNTLQVYLDSQAKKGKKVAAKKK